MAFTKINAAGIGSTETVTLDGLTVINDGSFGGNVSVGGTLTYEDVTNIDSVGLITARAGVVVGSGITLSKDGDIFATGVTTATSFVGDGSQLTGVASTENIRTNTNATFLQNINVSGSTTTGSLVSSGAISGTTGTFSNGLDVTNNVDITDSIRHKDDTDTIIRFPSNDQIQFETNGANRLNIDSTGKIKQTAASGDTIFTLKRSNTNTTGSFGVLNFAASDDHSVANIQSLGDGDNEGAHIVFKTTTAAASDDVYNAATVERLRITSSGSVGVGTETPAYKLDVVDGIINVGAAVTTNDARIQFTRKDTGIYSWVGIPNWNPNAFYIYGPKDSSPYNEAAATYESSTWSFNTAGGVRLQINSSGHVLPGANDSYDLGSESYRWRNLYTNDLNLSNEGSSNDVDGTWGNYTIQEGENDLFLINNRSGKKYMFILKEVS